MISKKIISMVSVAALVLVSASAMAGKGRGRGVRGDREGDRVDRMVRQLDLTPEQEAKVRALHEDHKSMTRSLREKVKDLKADMREAWRAEAPDEAAILTLQREIHAAKGELAEYRIQMRLDVMAILTPEQRQEARAHFKDRQKRGKGRSGKFKGRGRRGESEEK